MAKIAAILIAGAGALLLAPAPALVAPKTHMVVIDKMRFGAVPAGLRVGDTILWGNKDLFRHTATARDGSFTIDLAPGARGTIRLTRPGAIAFFCRYHPGMTGRLVVAK